MMLNKLIADEKPTHVIAAFDKGMPAERVALYARVQGAAPRDARRTALAVRARAPGPGDRIGIPDRRDRRPRGRRRDRDARAPSAKRPASKRSSLPAISICCRSSTTATTVLTTRRGITELGRYDPPRCANASGSNPRSCPITAASKGDPSRQSSRNSRRRRKDGEQTCCRRPARSTRWSRIRRSPAIRSCERLIEEYGAAGAPLPRRLDRPPRSAADASTGKTSRYRAPSGARTLSPL